MYKGILDVFFFIVLGVCALFSYSILAAEVCPAINCDCSQLPRLSWQQACLSYEQTLKQECLLNKGNPTKHCAIHGSNGYPLLLSLDIQSPLPEDSATIDDLLGQSEGLLWSLNTDASMAEQGLIKKVLPQVYRALKVVDSGFTSLLMTHRLLEKNTLNESKKSKKKNSKYWLKLSKKLNEPHAKIVNLIEGIKTAAKSETDTKVLKAYGGLLQAGWRVLAKSSELKGYALGRAGENSNAAVYWLSAASISKTLIDEQVKTGAQQNHIEYFNTLFSSQLYRGAYHYLIDGKVSEADQLLVRANKVVPLPEPLKTLLP